jgi:negative regulator of flagellin synthesis FlgM
VKVSGRSKGNEAKNVAYKKTGGVAPVSAASGSSGQGGVGEATDSRVAISDLGRVVAETAKLLESVPDIRVEKVERIQSALESGTYQVEGREVADRIVSEAVKEIRNRTR